MLSDHTHPHALPSLSRGDFLQVPMLIRGPGVTVGSTPSFIAGNTDLGPSFLDLAGVPTPAKMDGRSIIPMLIPNATAAAAAAAETRPWRTFFPVEFSGLHGWGGGRLNDCTVGVGLDPDRFLPPLCASCYHRQAGRWCVLVCSCARVGACALSRANLVFGPDFDRS